MTTIIMLLICSVTAWITCRVFDRKNPKKPKKIEPLYPEPRKKEVEM